MSFITAAYAQGAQGLFDNPALSSTLLPLIFMFAIFYFLLIRPQQKKAKEHKTMLAALRRGDRVVTGGGIIGTVAKVEGDEEVSVDIAEGTRVRVVRSTITAVLARTVPVAGKEEAPEPVADAPAKEKRKGSARGAGSK